MPNFVLILFLCMNVFAKDGSVYEENNMLPVTNSTSEKIRTLASGVCSIYYRADMKSGCSCFRISSWAIITNYHCLSMTHSDLFELAKYAPKMGDPLQGLYALVQSTPREILKKELERATGRSDYILPSNDEELIQLVNQTKDQLGYVNFQKHIDFDYATSSLKISKIIAVNQGFDYAIFEVKEMKKEIEILTFSEDEVRFGQDLIVIGHPAKSPFPGQVKVYDNSKMCMVSNESVDGNNRLYNFGHLCDTLGGSSGSPVIDRSTGKVVGLHWSGFTDIKSNRAIKAKQLKEQLKGVIRLKQK